MSIASPAHDAAMAVLAEMFPSVPIDKMYAALSSVHGDLDAAIDSLLKPQRSKRKCYPDIRAFFQQPIGAVPPPKKRHIHTSLPAEFVPSEDKNVVMASFSQWDPTKDPQKPKLLTSQTLSQHVPCLSLQLNFLSHGQADSLLHEMLTTSTDWVRTKWVIVDREVESPHHTQLYGVNEEQLARKADLYANTGTAATKMKVFPPVLQSITGEIEATVNQALVTRTRHPLEAPGPWVANIALGNVYRTSHESVGSHSDTMTELGPRPTIASLTLGAERIFRIKRLATDTMPAQTFNVQLPHNSLLIMFPPFQEFYRHEVPPQQPWQVKAHPVARETRVNITFRMMRSNYVRHMPRCHCGKVAVLRTANRPAKRHVGEYFYMETTTRMQRHLIATFPTRKRRIHSARFDQACFKHHWQSIRHRRKAA
ncbi:hypothetical protein, variant 1 [Aphanomyces invadans]|uniref:Fe2OG dioxygenase domain-containing protein n=1 Tax=Aphanomyces invadans TaxID=157072 RepID=A0A024U3S7_9STRA|nr:hypothetical protein, variant 1 [Aphanomyces invadans]ETW00547.1 hypothetical protein, variant 1 [Aphanomyces invadans]|eukprot:XP_008870682.1 hypothetical protein, variant 1 [Aphanomyces invadans]